MLQELFTALCRAAAQQYMAFSGRNLFCLRRSENLLFTRGVFNRILSARLFKFQQHSAFRHFVALIDPNPFYFAFGFTFKPVLHFHRIKQYQVVSFTNKLTFFHQYIQNRSRNRTDYCFRIRRRIWLPIKKFTAESVT